LGGRYVQELGVGIDEPLDQPRAGDPVDAGIPAGYPPHFIVTCRRNVVTSSILPRMATVLRDLTVAIQLAFFLLAVGTLTDWVRHRDRQRTYLVLALLF